MIIRCPYDRLVPLSELKPHPQNRNKHSKEQVKRLAAILKYQGWRYCVKVSKQSGYITSGHGRGEAAPLNGWTSVPVNYQDYDSPEQEYADVQADNAIASWAELDLASIHQDMKELPSLDVDLLGLPDLEIKTDTKEKSEKIDLNQQFIVAIHCNLETDMQTIYEEMTQRGFECKLIT